MRFRYSYKKMGEVLANSEDPDQTLHSVASVWSASALFANYTFRVCRQQWVKPIFFLISPLKHKCMLWVLIRSTSNKYPQQMMHNARKGPLCNLQTMEAQISLCKSAGWSGPSLSANRINEYCSICWRTEKAQIRLHRCSHWSGPRLSANCIRAFFERCTSYAFMEK